MGFVSAPLMRWRGIWLPYGVQGTSEYGRHPLPLQEGTPVRRQGRGGTPTRRRHRVCQGVNLVMILPQVHLRKPCYDFYFL